MVASGDSPHYEYGSNFLRKEGQSALTVGELETLFN